MILLDLKKEIEKWIVKGCGEKPIYTEAGAEQGDYEIDSIQKNTCPDKDPDYLFIMIGNKVI